MFYLRYINEKRPNGVSLLLGCADSNHPSNHRTPVWWTGDIEYTALGGAINDMISYGMFKKQKMEAKDVAMSA